MAAAVADRVEGDDRGDRDDEQPEERGEAVNAPGERNVRQEG